MDLSSALQHSETMSGAPVVDLLRHCDADVTERLLDRLPQAVVLVDPRGTVARLNERAAAIVAQGDGLMIHHGVLRCARPADTAALHRLIGEVAQRDEYGDGTMRCGLPIHRAVGRRPLTALVTALCCRNALQNGETVIVVLVNDPEHAPALDVQMLRDWYDLTPAEARVAMLLASGLRVEEIVERLGTGANTVRTHLKSIFAKTDTRRQGELIRLLLSNPMLGSERDRNIFLGSHPNG
jgi:DNA-binding CsgD family transcriptional regulator